MSRSLLRRLSLHRLRLPWLLALATLLSACASTAHYPINPPLAAVTPHEGYRARGLFRQAGDEELMVIVTFSGGGSRAAALAYGVLEQLARTPIEWHGRPQRLLDEVDLVAGVSGGSITAAYWALAGDRIFEDFEPRFLQRDLQSRLIDRITSVRDFWRTTSPRFGRGDLLAEELDQALFQGATFGDLVRRDRGPLAIISAAELSTGARFDFLQETFDWLCSDLSRFPLARAVAASSSVPLLFSPITLWNRAGECGTPTDLRSLITPEQLATLQGTRLERRMKDDLRLQDRNALPYLHLVDGGVADNLALRGLLDLDGLARLSPQKLFDKADLENVKRLVVVAVDAGNESTTTIASSADVPKVGQVAEALSDVLIARYSDETRALVAEVFQHWRSLKTADQQQLPIHIVPVSFRLLPDEQQRRELLALPTSLFLPAEQVQRLRQAAGQLVRQSPDYQRLVREIGAPSPATGSVNAD